MPEWTLDNARQTYNIDHWSSGYFGINQKGHVVAYPDRNPEHPGIDLKHIADECREHGLSFPLLLRFNDILHDRVTSLHTAFDKAITAHDYQGSYLPVYPIKVNQQRSVVHELLSTERWVGLEAGSKPELLAVLALAEQNSGTIICNGYKDREYIRLALIGKALGHRITLVIEKLSELSLVLDEAQRMGIRPYLGLRARMASVGSGQWQNTGGEKSKFGLSAHQSIQLVERLKALGMEDCLHLLHFHLGSQIANIDDIHNGMRECTQYFTDLIQLGAKLDTIDVGGGLSVDYDGTHSTNTYSANYSLDDYALAIVAAVNNCCQHNDVTPPNLITESGRAMTAHHAVLITNVVDHEQQPQLHLGEDELLFKQTTPEADRLLNALHSKDHALRQTQQAYVDYYYDAELLLNNAHELFRKGQLNLAQRAQCELLFASICWQLKQVLTPDAHGHERLLDRLNERLADKVFCNFSLFQSLPDVWAIDQIFPIMPIHRLEERPTRRGVLEDITCDSDGRIDEYVDNQGLEHSLPLHSLVPGEHYLLGIFLTGAYQEILGDMHNLFGDTDSVHVSLTQEGGYRIDNPLRGDTVGSVLRYVHFNPEELRRIFEQKVRRSGLDNELGYSLLRELEAGLTGYTYLED